MALNKSKDTFLISNKDHINYQIITCANTSYYIGNEMGTIVAEMRTYEYHLFSNLETVKNLNEWGRPKWTQTKPKNDRQNQVQIYCSYLLVRQNGLVGILS